MSEGTPTPEAADSSLLVWMLGFLRPYGWRVALLALLSVIEIGLGALAPWPLKVVIDNVLQNQKYPFPEPVGHWLFAAGGNLTGVLLIVVVAGVLLQIVSQFVSMFHTQVQVGTGQRLVYDLRFRLFQHLQALGLQHHIATNTGDAVYRLESDAYSIDNLVMSGLFPLATAIVTLLVMFTVLVKIDWMVALLSLTIVPFLYLCLRWYMNTLVMRTEKVRELESKLVERVYEIFSAMRLVKSFAREDHEAARFRTLGDEVMGARISITWQESLFSVVVTSIILIGTAIVTVVGGLHVVKGQMTIGELTIVLAYLAAVYNPLSSIAHTTGQLQGALAGARRVRKIFAMVPETVEAPGAIEATDVKGHIAFEGVGFTYDNGTRVLHDIAFEAKPGQMIAVVGLTGAGKTTLASLIPRFYDATEGRVSIDGVDVHGYQVRSLREKISIVLQDPVLFSGTIGDNLRYGRLDATQAEVEAAAKAAHAHDFIMRLPKGYDMPVAEAGGGFSGGERQRLSVARAILKNAPILILDEPTSSLDAISEEIVFAALRRLRVGRTTIVIAHRLSTVRDADSILVLDGGLISAHGHHEELLKSSQLYRRMCARLSVGKSLDEPETVDELIEAAKL